MSQIENTVILYGVVITKPKIMINNEGKYQSMIMQVLTTRRAFRRPDSHLIGKYRYDKVLVFTLDPNIIQSVIDQKINSGDMVLVKGSISYVHKNTSYTCPICGDRVRVRNISSLCVSPVFLGVWERGIKNNQQIMSLLDSKYEISNMVYISGTLLEDPEEDDGGRTFQCTFKIDYEDKVYEDPEVNPTIRVKGLKAEEAMQVLHEDSEIFINGTIRGQQVYRPLICPHCNNDIEVEDVINEIIPYSIEYGRNCDVEILPGKEEEEFEDE